MGGQVPDRYLGEILARMQPLLPSVSQRSDRPSKRILIGRAGGDSAALGGATLPLFSRLTTQPRATRARPRPTRQPVQRELSGGDLAVGGRPHD